MGGRHGGPVVGPVLSHPVLHPWSSSRQPFSDKQFVYANNEGCTHSHLKIRRGDILQILPTLYSSECCEYIVIMTGVRHVTRLFSGVARREQWRPSIPTPHFKRPISVLHVL
jgi:hypothetical protein